jgi:hypothetical protein
MKSPFFAVPHEVAAFELAFMQAADELNHPRANRRRARKARRHGDRRQ